MTKSGTYNLLATAQANWARGAVKNPDKEHADYVAPLEDNLFLGRLGPDTERDFKKGDGAELRDVGQRPAKMRALLSSSALAVNVFDYWRTAGPRELSSALGLDQPITQVQFEYQCSNYPVRPPSPNLKQRSPNLDVLLTLVDGSRVAIESKFSEPYRSKARLELAAKHFENKDGLWSGQGLHGCQRLANALKPEGNHPADWHHLDVPQLLKHMLGLSHDDPGRHYTLIYLWFDPGTPDAIRHKQEIDLFTKEVANDALAFRSMTYQDFFNRLRGGLGVQHSDYCSYLKGRYFPGAGVPAGTGLA